MATDKEYKAVIDALSGECERLHKTINNIRAEINDAAVKTRNADKRDGLYIAREIVDRYR